VEFPQNSGAWNMTQPTRKKAEAIPINCLKKAVKKFQENFWWKKKKVVSEPRERNSKQSKGRKGGKGGGRSLGGEVGGGFGYESLWRGRAREKEEIAGLQLETTVNMAKLTGEKKRGHLRRKCLNNSHKLGKVEID